MNLAHLIQQQGKPLTRKKGEHLFRQGDDDRNLYFLQSGLLKAYYLSEEGKEHVKSFIQSQETIGSLSAAYDNAQCTFGVICLEDCQLMVIPFSAISKEADDDIGIANEVIRLLLQLSMKKERREYEFLCLSAETRFKLLTERSPDLIERVTQNDLARYLGITPVALSRIKKRVQAN